MKHTLVCACVCVIVPSAASLGRETLERTGSQRCSRRSNHWTHWLWRPHVHRLLRRPHEVRAYAPHCGIFRFPRPQNVVQKAPKRDVLRQSQLDHHRRRIAIVSVTQSQAYLIGARARAAWLVRREGRGCRHVSFCMARHAHTAEWLGGDRLRPRVAPGRPRRGAGPARARGETSRHPPPSERAAGGGESV